MKLHKMQQCISSRILTGRLPRKTKYKKTAYLFLYRELSFQIDSKIETGN
jgi:hypothetical protein